MPHKYVLPYLPVSLPATPIKDNVDTKAIANHFTHVLNYLEEKNFKDDAVWRDHFALTGSIRTFYGPRSIGKAWSDTCKAVKPSSFVIAQPGHVMRPGKFAWIDMYFTFETNGVPAINASGFLSVVPVDGDWKIWVLRTILEDLKGQPNVDHLEPPHSYLNRINGMNGTTNGVHGTSSVNGYLNGEIAHFDTVVVGGGQAGLCSGGRLKALGLSYVVLDKQAEPGDSWRTRYDSTRCKPSQSSSLIPFMVHELTFFSTYNKGIW